MQLLLIRHRDPLLGTLGLLIFCLGWEVVGRAGVLGLGMPPLSTVIHVFLEPTRAALIGRALRATLQSLFTGYGIGAIAGVCLAALTHVLPILRPGADRASAFISSIPSIALAPVLILFLGQGAAPAAVSALSSFFILYVAMSSSLSATSAALRDLVHVFGGSRMTRLWLIGLPSAWVDVIGGMRLAASASLIGVIVGEWFGAPRGLGVLIISAMQNFHIPLLWASVLTAVAVSMTLYALIGTVQSWAKRRFE